MGRPPFSGKPILEFVSGLEAACFRQEIGGSRAHLAKPFDVGELILVIVGLVAR